MSHIKILTTIGADPAQVFERFATLPGVRDWWTSDALGGGEPGQRLSLGFGGAKRLVLDVASQEPGRRVEWVPAVEDDDRWRGTRIVCTFEPCDGALPWQTRGTALRLEHAGFAEFGDPEARCNTTWARLLRGFKRMCERGGPSPQRWDGT